jgi:hypothetical protein
MFSLTLLGSACLVGSTAQAQTYTAWTKNVTKNRYECTVTYTAKGGGTATQTVLTYPEGTDRAGWYYFVSKEGNAWGRCACPGNPKYDTKVMFWQQLNTQGTGYENYSTVGFCPAPGNGKETIMNIPDPPQ